MYLHHITAISTNAFDYHPDGYPRHPKTMTNQTTIFPIMIDLPHSEPREIGVYVRLPRKHSIRILPLPARHYFYTIRRLPRNLAKVQRRYALRIVHLRSFVIRRLWNRVYPKLRCTGTAALPRLAWTAYLKSLTVHHSHDEPQCRSQSQGPAVCV